MTRALLATLLVAVACGGDTGDPKVGECQDYCTLIGQHCEGGVAQYADGAACIATCEAMEIGTPDVHSGNTISCRTFMAAAAEGDTDLCPMAGPGGYGVCGSPCENFCALAAEICTGDLAAYPDDAACMSACAGFAADPPFDSSDQGGDTFECRLYHLTAASVDPGLHCAHIGPTSSTCF